MLKKKLINNKVNILLTRPEKDSKKIYRFLDKEKFKFFIAPLIEISFNKYKFDRKMNYDLVIFTSRNGILNFRHSLRKTKIFVIGDGTFLLAKERGLENVINIKGNLENLKTMIEPFLKPNFKILHPTSTKLNKCLKDFFNLQHCTYNPIGCYESKMVNSNAERFENFFNSCKDGLITLFSRRTAISFKNEISKLGYLKDAQSKKILVLSKVIAEELKDISLSEVFISKKPNEQGMIDLIEKISHKENLID